MTVRTYLAREGELRRINLIGSTLDAASLQLPEGVYTTLRTNLRTHIPGLSAHLQRLADSHAIAGKTGLLNLASIRAALRAVIERENLPAARLRITKPFEGDALYISVEPFESYPPECYARGVLCKTSRMTRDMPRAKLTSFIAPSRACKAQIDPSVHEILLVDEDERILEGITSNFFAVLDDALRTAGEGVLQGVTRELVLAQTADVIAVVYTPITRADLPRVAEAFITSSSRGVMPVKQIDEIAIGRGDPGRVTRQLMTRYQDHLMQVSEIP